jgi:hypothetical protein
MKKQFVRRTGYESSGRSLLKTAWCGTDFDLIQSVHICTTRTDLCTCSLVLSTWWWLIYNTAETCSGFKCKRDIKVVSSRSQCAKTACFVLEYKKIQKLKHKNEDFYQHHHHLISAYFVTQKYSHMGFILYRVTWHIQLVKLHTHTHTGNPQFHIPAFCVFHDFMHFS